MNPVLSDQSQTNAKTSLSPYQAEVIDLFVHAAQALSIPRSVGEIYGLLYSLREPVPMDDVISLLRISKGSASQGLRWLRDIGAVRSTYVNGDRRDHYVAEIELRRLASGFLREKVEPHLESGGHRLARIESLIATEADPEFATDRLQKLRKWHSLIKKILPFVRGFAKAGE